MLQSVILRSAKKGLAAFALSTMVWQHGRG